MKYLIIPASRVPEVEFMQVKETGPAYVRYNNDNSKTFIKWDGETPDCVTDITSSGTFCSLTVMLRRRRAVQLVVVVFAQAAGVEIDDLAQQRRVLLGGQQLVHLLLVLDHREGGAGMIQHIGGLFGGGVGVDGHGNGAAHLRRDHRPVELGTVLADHHHALARGEAETVLVVSAGKFPPIRDGGRELMALVCDHAFEMPYGPSVPALYGLIAQAWMHETGQGKADIAEVTVSQDRWAALNPAAIAHGAQRLTVEDVLASRCALHTVPSLAEQARHKLPTKQHLPCKSLDEVDRLVDVRHLFGETDASTARTLARNALERAEAALESLRKRGLRPTCCARTGTPICKFVR